MGYTNPRININQSLGVINKEVANFNEQFDQEFGKLNDRNMANIQANLEEAERQKARRLMGDQAWYETVEKFRPKGGYKEKNDELLRSLHDKYYDLLGCDTKECVEQRNKLLQVPRNMSEERGGYAGLLEIYNNATNINELEPGSVNYMLTDKSTIDFLTNADQYTPEYDDVTGAIVYKKYDKEGNVTAQMNGRDFTQGALSGNISISTYGDPSAIRKEIHKKQYDQLGINNLGINEIDKSDPNFQTKVTDYTQARGVYNNAIQDDRLYEPIMANTTTMRKDYPVIINDLVKRAKTGDKQAIDALGPILGGEDGVYMSGGDDDVYGPQAAAGQWKNSPEQRSAALTYFKTDNPNDNIMPPLTREMEEIRKDGLTAYQQAQVSNQIRDDRRAERTLDLKEEQQKLKANENRNASENTRLRKIDQILKIEAKEEDGTATEEDIKIKEDNLKAINASTSTGGTTVVVEEETDPNATATTATGGMTITASDVTIEESAITAKDPKERQAQINAEFKKHEQEGKVVSFKNRRYVYKNGKWSEIK